MIDAASLVAVVPLSYASLASLSQSCAGRQMLRPVTFFAGVLFLLPALRPAPGLDPPCAIVSLLYQFATAAVQVDVTFADSFFNSADEDSGVTVVFVDFPASAVGYESKFTQFLDAVENRCVTHCLSPLNIYAAVRSWWRLRNIFTRQASCFALKFLRRVVKTFRKFFSHSLNWQVLFLSADLRMRRISDGSL